jgi:hypothetical protein
VDSSVTVSGTVVSSLATGIVSLYQGNTSTGIVIDSFPLSGGNYGGSTTFLPGGSYQVIAHYGGDGTFAASDSPATAVNIAKQSSHAVVGFVTFDANGNPILPPNTGPVSVSYGSSYILRVDVENGSLQTCQNLSTGAIQFICPTGTVTLSANGSPLKDFPQAQNANATNVANLNDRGFAEDQPIQLPASSTPYNIVAAYSGDNSYSANTSSGESVTITKATTTTAVTASPTSIASGGTVTLTATVSSNSNGDAPCGSGVAGTVQFMNGISAISGSVAYTGTSGAQSSAGLASCTATLTTTLSALGIPDTTSPWRPKVPQELLWLLGCCAALYGLLVWKMPRARRRGYAYAGLVFFALTAAGIAGCGGGGGSSTPPVKTATITANFSGDTNYTASSNTTTVTIQ